MGIERIEYVEVDGDLLATNESYRALLERVIVR